MPVYKTKQLKMTSQKSGNNLKLPTYIISQAMITYLELMKDTELHLCRKHLFLNFFKNSY